MNAKKYLVAAILFSTALLVVAASFCQTKRDANEPNRTALTGPSGKFGPVIEAVLPAAKTQRPADVDILDFETGRVILQPPIEYFNSRANTIMTWIRSNSLDISCAIWPSGAACVTYDLTVVPIETKNWEETTEEELLNNPALAPGRHSPRRLLVLGPGHPDTYLFRTGEGTLGMLRIGGLSRNGRGVSICYKLINPAKSRSVASNLSKS